MYCNNCGGKGHLFRTCRDPVLSCGIILIDKPSIPANPILTEVLMIRRKDSMSFAEFMRGKYDPADDVYVGRLLANMTVYEESMVRNETFDSLWKRLWGDDHSSPDYTVSRDKFTLLDRERLCDANQSKYTESEWGFPKGRRVRGESDIDCAIREFNEETNIPRESYVLLKNIKLEETFTGLNGVQYRHIYFVALLTQPDMINLTQRFTTMQRREISGIAWKSMIDCKALARPHHVERCAMIESLNSILETFETV